MLGGHGLIRCHSRRFGFTCSMIIYDPVDEPRIVLELVLEMAINGTFLNQLHPKAKKGSKMKTSG